MRLPSLLVALLLLTLPGGAEGGAPWNSPGEGPGRAPARQAGTIRVLSYNIHAGKDAAGVDNLDRVAEVIREAGADLVLLQEVDRGTERSGGVDQLGRLARATGLQGAFGKTLDYQGGEYGIALLSRWPIRSDTLIPLPIEPPQERAGGSHEPRGALHASLDHPEGELHVLNTHLDASADDGYRWQEIQRVLAVADSLRTLGYPVLFGGDLNALPDTRIVREARRRGWRDGWEGCGEGPGLTYPAGDPVRRIDYLFLGPGLECREAGVIPTIASDHRPVAMTLETARAAAAAPQAVAGTDLWLFPLAPGGEKVEVEGAVRVTRRPGYDNQPSFLPDGRALLYTVIDESGQADIWRYDLETRLASPVTRTAPESEYSATVTPAGDRFSAIRVEADSTQRLWSFTLDGGDPRLVLPDVQPVGYHAWLAPHRLVLFVLGSPATLQVASPGAGPAREVARDIGRSLHRIPGRGTASFVQRGEGGEGWITEFDPATGRTRALAPLLEGNEYHAWTPDGVLLMAAGSKVFRWRSGEEGWEEVGELERVGIRGATRLAVSPDGRWLVVVGEEG